MHDQRGCTAHRYRETEQDDKLHDGIYKSYKPFHSFLFTTLCDYPACLPFLAELEAPFEIKPDSVVIVDYSAPDDIGT